MTKKSHVTGWSLSQTFSSRSREESRTSPTKNAATATAKVAIAPPGGTDPIKLFNGGEEPSRSMGRTAMTRRKPGTQCAIRTWEFSAKFTLWSVPDQRKTARAADIKLRVPVRKQVRGSSTPELFEPRRVGRSVPDGVLDVAVPEVVLNEPSYPRLGRPGRNRKRVAPSRSAVLATPARSAAECPAVYRRYPGSAGSRSNRPLAIACQRCSCFCSSCPGRSGSPVEAAGSNGRDRP